MVTPISFSLVSDTSSAIPGGIGTFTGHPPDPCISFGSIAFRGTGSGQAGVYAAVPTDPWTLFRVADLTTLIPGGSGAFQSWPGDPWISGNNIAFIGLGSGGQQGIYVCSPPGLPQAPPDPCKVVADLNTAIPAGSGLFTQFWPVDPIPIAPDPMISGNNVAFWGAGANSQEGIYALLSGGLQRIADTSTPLPGSSFLFTIYGYRPALSGANVAFIGQSGSALSGVYLQQPVDPAKIIADSSMGEPRPGASFSSFDDVVLDGTTVAFTARHS